MAYKKKGKKGSKMVDGLRIVNEECKECLYYNKNQREGRHDAVVPCMFAKTQEHNIENWLKI